MTAVLDHRHSGALDHPGERHLVVVRRHDEAEIFVDPLVSLLRVGERLLVVCMGRSLCPSLKLARATPTCRQAICSKVACVVGALKLAAQFGDLRLQHGRRVAAHRAPLPFRHTSALR